MCFYGSDVWNYVMEQIRKRVIILGDVTVAPTINKLGRPN